jgi:hypothetical protein
LRDELGDGRGLIAFGLELGLDIQGYASLGLVRPGRAVRGERGNGLAGDQRMVLDQGLRRLAEAWRAAVAGNRHSAGLARDGARLGAGAEGLGNAEGHRPNMAVTGWGWKPSLEGCQTIVGFCFVEVFSATTGCRWLGVA